MNVYQSESAQNKYKKWRKACLITTLAFCSCFFIPSIFAIIISIVTWDDAAGMGVDNMGAVLALIIGAVALLPSVLLAIIAAVSWKWSGFGGVASCVIAILPVFFSIIWFHIGVLPLESLVISIPFIIIGSMNIITWQIKRSIEQSLVNEWRNMWTPFHD